MLQSANDHYERQAALTVAALRAAKTRPWRDVERIAQIVALYQLAAAQDALDSMDPMLAEQGLNAPPVGRIQPQAFAGTASDGRPLTSLLQQAVSPETLGLMVVTQVQDMGRTAAMVSTTARPRLGYIRMVNPGACSRCVILAGKFYRFNQGFLRHPRCACRHIPSVESIAGDLTTDPHAYFDSLTEAEQDKTFTKAGAEAIRLGADPSQVVNARRVTDGMQFAGSPAIKRQYGNLYTTEGSTVRAVAYQQQLGLRRNGAVQDRLMPESILDGTRTREEAQRLLKLYGYILDDTARAAGRSQLAAARQAQRAERARQRRAERAAR